MNYWGIHWQIAYLIIAAVLSLAACEVIDDDIDKHVTDRDSTFIGLDAVAGILSDIPLTAEHLKEVHSAVSSSSENGYDEEYTMKHLFSDPGSGVGDEPSKAPAAYANPMRSLIEQKVRSMSGSRRLFRTRADAVTMDPETFLSALESSDIQIYWPFSDQWNGEDFPVITFDPEDGSYNNIGFRLVYNDDGSRQVEKMIVDEEVAAKVPVWVVNRNSDAGYTSLEMLRREDPEWGEGGGSIIVKPVPTRTSASKALILKDFTMNRNYDTWFAGASEFFVKIGYLDDFTATTESELRLYNPLVTDFMIVVRRDQVGKPQPFNAILMSDWSSQMSHCAFMITEDDGGTRTDWNCTALVRIASKSYGVEMKIPFNSRDDIVWRGQLANRWIEQNNNVSWAFGDVNLTFEMVEY